ncbi:hypothetical protein AV654_00435 [Paenibacillus elgii]|uniref:Uncharacterized protein n=1 Tax=Paenibacillus elgii TaxID=189691 RepID=A0A164AR76_9BACL|nr:hypothetical protein AV654_00435 [Paenibacillus elgii]
MAVRRWPKWVVGISSVVSFTGFLYATQSQQEPEKPLPASASNGLDASGTAAAAAGAAESTLQTANTSARLFLYTPDSMQQIAKMSDADKSEREKLLEQLNWEADPSAEITLTAPAKKSADQAAASTPASARKTRRS